MLSDKQYELLTSQDSEIKGISEQKARIIEKADLMMNTLRIIINSNSIDQEDKDEIFPKHRITSMIHNLISYDNEATAKQESNKQEIAIDLMQQSLRYFQSRYKEVFIKKEIKVFEQFAEDIKEFTEKQIAETRAQELNKTRQTLQPPLLYPAETTWKAVCIECHSHREDGNDEDVIKTIRHTRNCSIHDEKKRLKKVKDGKERIKMQYYKIIPPLKKSKKN